MYKRILIVVGKGPAQRSAVTQGVALAKVHGAEVIFFSVLPRYIVPVADMPMIGMPSPQEFQREATANAGRLMATATVVADMAGISSRTAVGAGADDAECIIEAARKRRCGLIVVASAGRNAVMRLISGSVIPGLITHATVPVLIVREGPAASTAKQSAGAKPPTRSARVRVAKPVLAEPVLAMPAQMKRPARRRVAA